MNRWAALAWLLALAGALLLRVPQPGVRPLHNDEGVNATKLAALWERGEYRYDPHEYHGPTLHYFSLPILWLSKADDSAQLSNGTLRTVAIVFGVALIFLLLLMVDGLGRLAAAWAAIFLAVSPAMVFYSRYFIHEMLLVFFTLFTLAAGWRYAQSRQARWAALAGAGAGLMFATKETFVLTFAAMIFALLATRLWNQWRRQRLSSATDSTAPHLPRARWTPSARHLGLAITTGLAVWCLFFTSFLTNPAGLMDSVATYLPWLSRAGGESPHVQPWYFYFERLLWFHPPKSPPWTELVILILAFIGAAAGFCGNRARVEHPAFVRFLTFFTISLTAIYTVISYKTPWCALNFWLGAILLAGVGATVLIESFRPRIPRGLATVLVGVAALHLGTQSWLLAQTFSADLRNPYVYAQTSPHAQALVDRVRAIAQVAPERFETTIKVISPESYWPLPWSLREFKNVGWFDALPADPFAPIVLSSAKLNARLDDKSDKRWIMTGYYELRPNVFFELYVELALWEKFVATLPREEE